jgi:hypothetical protein
LRRQLAADHAFGNLRVAEDAAAFRVVFGENQVPLADHHPSHLTAQQPLPSFAKRPLTVVLLVRPASDVHQQRRFGEMQILGQVFQRIAGEQVLLLSVNSSASVRSMARTVRWK